MALQSRRHILEADQLKAFARKPLRGVGTAAIARLLQVGEPPEPELPPPDERGNYPAFELTRAVMARDYHSFAPRVGLVGSRAGPPGRHPAETLNRIEQAKRSPSLSTFDKIHRALESGEAKQRTSRSKGKARK